MLHQESGQVEPLDPVPGKHALEEETRHILSIHPLIGPAPETNAPRPYRK
jgi:hypothetical protein